MNDLYKELLKRVSVLFLVLGLFLVVLAANQGLPIAGAKSFSPSWVTGFAIVGGVLAVAGAVMAIIDWRRTVPGPVDVHASKASATGGVLDRTSLQQLQQSGLSHAFRIPTDNAVRLDRVVQLIHEEVEKGEGHLRLTASSGHSYLNPNGAVWKAAGIGDLIASGRIREFDVVLESPFTSFAETRALANNVSHHQWEEKQIIDHLVELIKYPNVNLRVTLVSITCSLFMTSRAVYYDPYLWSLPTAMGRTENNFWVFEFDRVTDPKLAQLDCYGLLERHFEFLQKNSIAMEKLLHLPESNGKVPRKDQFIKLFDKNRSAALNHYEALTADFHARINKRLKENK
jgi:hypothetical protein